MNSLIQGTRSAFSQLGKFKFIPKGELAGMETVFLAITALAIAALVILLVTWGLATVTPPLVAALADLLDSITSLIFIPLTILRQQTIGAWTATRARTSQRQRLRAILASNTGQHSGAVNQTIVQ